MRFYKAEVTCKEGRQKREIHNIIERGTCFGLQFIPIEAESPNFIQRGHFMVNSEDYDSGRCSVSTSGVISYSEDPETGVVNVETRNTFYKFTPVVI